MQLRVFAVVVSLFVHMAIVLTAALVIVYRSEGNSGRRGEVPLAVISESELTDLLEVSLQDSQAAIESPLEDQISVDDLPTLSDDTLLGTVDLTDLSDLAGAGNVSGTGSGLDIGSGGGSARFFGVEAQGSRFAFVVDVSGSMGLDVEGGGGTRLDALKVELLESIGGLLEHMHFVVVFYNQEAIPVGSNRWFAARDRTKQELGGLIRAQPALGGTNPLPAFEMVFDLKPRPDAIYFMTDGQFGRFTQRVIDVVDRRNREGRKLTPIHCITFDNREAEDVMREIAQQSGGTYKHVGGGGGGRNSN
jgi:hypothetical protein